MFLRFDSWVAQPNALRFQRDFREPKVENLRLTSIRDKDVRWLDVPVDDSFRMRGVESVGDLDAQIKHRFDLQGLARLWRVLREGTSTRRADLALGPQPHKPHPCPRRRSCGRCGNGTPSAPRV